MLLQRDCCLDAGRTSFLPRSSHNVFVLSMHSPKVLPRCSYNREEVFVRCSNNEIVGLMQPYRSGWFDVANLDWMHLRRKQVVPPSR